MPAAKLESLPLEIFLLICEYLDHVHTPSVVALACASKYCYSVTTALLFRTLKFSVSSRRRLARDVQEYSKILQQTASFIHVRHLIIDGDIPKDDGEPEPEPQDQWRRPKMSAAEHASDAEKILEILEKRRNYKGPLRYKPPKAVYNNNHIWKPLATLIKQLPVLETLFYACPGQFAPCLLESLHQHHPQCRLYLNVFWLHSLSAPETDEHEFALVTSPCLYSIAIQSRKMYGYQSDGNHNYQVDAIMDLVAGLAVNLKEVNMYHYPPGKSDESDDDEIPWKGFTQDKKQVESSQGSLHYLRLSRYFSLTEQGLEIWSKHTDFSALRTLKVEGGIDGDALDYLATNCNFQSLTNLELQVTPYYNHPQLEQIIEYFHSAECFLRSVPKLSALTLFGWHPDLLLDSILEHHGSSLRRLELFTLDGVTSRLQDLTQINKHCPLLEALALPVRRSKGDAKEVALYKAIGTLPKLRYLSLRLDASDTTVLRERDEDVSPNDSSFEEFDQQFCKELFFGTYQYPRNGHIRDALINSALDKELARAIFQVISSGKPKGSLPLESLKVQVTGGGQFGSNLKFDGFHDILEKLGHPWHLKRNPREDARDEIFAKKMESDSKLRHVYSKAFNFDIMPIFRRIWPTQQRGYGGSWDDYWHSLPLAISDS